MGSVLPACFAYQWIRPDATNIVSIPLRLNTTIFVGDPGINAGFGAVSVEMVKKIGFCLHETSKKNSIVINVCIFFIAFFLKMITGG
jgi:hypothetical protein